MLRNLRSGRQPRYGAQICAVMSALLLLLSVALLYNRLSSSSSSHDPNYRHLRFQSQLQDEDEEEIVGDSDSDSGSRIYQNFLVGGVYDDNQNDVLDRIDELDTIKDVRDENDDVVLDGGDQDLDKSSPSYTNARISSSGYFIDHVTGSIRRALSKRSIGQWNYDYNHDLNSNSFGVGFGGTEDESKVTKAAFASDDMPVEEAARRKLNEVDGIDDALLLKIGKRASPLRQGWEDWFDKKSDFLSRDGMFKSSMEAMNPTNNALLQDPDGVGVTKLTRGDKAVQRLLLSEFKSSPFLAKKSQDL